MGSARAILAEARAAGLSLAPTDSGGLSYAGPTEAFEQLRPILVAHKRAILAELEREAEENARLMNWWRQPVPGWREGRLTICNITTGRVTVINLRTSDE